MAKIKPLRVRRMASPAYVKPYQRWPTQHKPKDKRELLWCALSAAMISATVWLFIVTLANSI